MKFEWDPDHVPGVKLGLHITQIVLAFAAWCLELAVFSGKGAKVVGYNGWTFGVCFISIPAWIYLIGTPRFARTRKLAHPAAMLAIDGLMVVLWLSAFATQATYNAKGLCGSRCSLSKAIVALGVIITLLFGGTTFVSAYTMTFYNFHGNLPGYDNRKVRSGSNDIDPDKEAFSMAPHDEEAYERVQADDHEHEGPGSYSGRYGDANPYSSGDMHEQDDPNRYGGLPSRQDEGSHTMFDSNTSYNPGAASMPYAPQAPSYSDEPARFPEANYDRVVR